MQQTVFKPNPKNTGGLLTLKIAMTKNDKKDLWSKVLFAEFIPQKSWNDSTKTGSFEASKRRVVAINPNEAGEILYSIDRNVPFQNYHQSEKGSCWVKFIPYTRERKVGKEGDKSYWVGNVDNFAFGYSEKGAGVNIPFTSGEAQELKLLLESYIKESMALDAKEQERKFKAKGKETAKDDEPSSSEEEDLNETQEEEDDSIPF